VKPRITVVGSINVDLVARCERLPRPGETVTGATFARYPGGKGSNQAVACARLGAEVTMIGAVGGDALAEEALAGLRSAAIALELVESESPTGIAVILVDATGETEIVVAPGANAELMPLRSGSTTPSSASSRCPTPRWRRRGRRAPASSA
jgi:ribokinase